MVRGRTRFALQQVFQRLEVVLDSCLVPGELLVGHFRPANKSKHELAPLAIGYDPHGCAGAENITATRVGSSDRDR